MPLLLPFQAVKADVEKTITKTFSEEDFILTHNSAGALEITSNIHDISYEEDANEPGLPLVPVNVLIPSGTSFREVNISKNTRLLIENVDIAANPIPIPTDGSYKETIESIQHYQNKTYPESCAKNVGTSIMDGFTVLNFLVSPFEYDARQKKLYIHESVTLDISLASSTEKASQISSRTGRNMRDIVKSLVINAEDVDTYQPDRSSSSYEDSIHYAIITSSALAPYFQPLANWKTKKGVKTSIITLEYIVANYTGATTPIKIKTCLYDLYQNKSLKYALLGGDDTVVPVQGCFCKVNGTIDYNIPTDLYYACFGGSFNWDNDGDGIYGETTDNINMTPSIFVTRVPVRSVSHVNAFVTKLLTYERTPTINGWGNNILMAGSKLWGNITETKSDAEAKGDNLYSNYILPSWNGTRKKFYDTYTDFEGGSNYVLDSINLQAQISCGYTFFDMVTHGDKKSWRLEYGLYTNTWANQLANNKPTIITTMACLTNAFDSSSNDPCLSEALIRNSNSGVIGYLGCSRYGWDYSGTSNLGPSMQYDAQFYQKLFSSDISNKNFGAIVAAAKMAKINSCGYYGSPRWVQFGLNPIGDSEMPIFTTTPMTFSDCEVSYYSGSLTIDTGVEGCTICIMSSNDNGASYYHVLYDVEEVTITGLPAEISVCITKQNYIPKEFDFSTSTIYIQNETVRGHQTYEADTIKVGTSVTTTKPTGPVEFNGGDIQLRGNIVTLEPQTTVNKNTNFVISTP
jgi:hypothetical protein